MARKLRRKLSGYANRSSKIRAKESINSILEECCDSIIKIERNQKLIIQQYMALRAGIKVLVNKNILTQKEISDEMVQHQSSEQDSQNIQNNGSINNNETDSCDQKQDILSTKSEGIPVDESKKSELLDNCSPINVTGG